MFNSLIPPGKTIGIVGGGQLGRMMALAAREMGYYIAVLDPTEHSPCGQIADIEVIGQYDDLDAIKRLAAVSDVITYEFENINAEMVRWLQSNSYVPQGSHVLEITQNRKLEKSLITKLGLQVPAYRIVKEENELYTAISDIGYPCVVKTCIGGYDGKGQVVVKAEADIIDASKLLTYSECIVEKWMPLDKEISVIVQRNVNGDTTCFPVAENIHRHHILHQTIVPARIDKHQQDQALHYAKVIADGLELVGTLTVEMFMTNNQDIYINELAPRPHNSGHFSIEACTMSQFQQHIRAICNWPLSEPELLKPAVMVNLLGEHVERAIGKIECFSDIHLHLYGKKVAKEKRKMGHITVLADKIEDAVSKAESLAIWKRTEEYTT
ncbi:5-(carboxyamino)imidazole ribonucleotide synthase [Metabacillus iocasae]|uniref:5-(carboxyamino)imidazole ribonucleotide synthase n=1 Tax=Priestia iocasae TaxID=2291674 RepID=UPI00196265E9|nr:5-(carboxyamino)imidazole ribonucleotide synthase [Metabacillus iocasae]